MVGALQRHRLWHWVQGISVNAGARRQPNGTVLSSFVLSFVHQLFGVASVELSLVALVRTLRESARQQLLPGSYFFLVDNFGSLYL